MRILILDDDAKRHAWFAKALAGNDVQHCYTYYDAISTLDSSENGYHVVYLDHDLNDFTTFQSVIEDTYGKVELTGEHVAKYIANCLSENKKPDEVIVHSWNPDGAKRMVAVLREAGIPVTYAPFQGET